MEENQNRTSGAKYVASFRKVIRRENGVHVVIARIPDDVENHEAIAQEIAASLNATSGHRPASLWTNWSEFSIAAMAAVILIWAGNSIGPLPNDAGIDAQLFAGAGKWSCRLFGWLSAAWAAAALIGRFVDDEPLYKNLLGNPERRP